MRVTAAKPRTRAQRVLRALTAAGAPVAAGQLPTIELPRFGLPVMVFWDAVLAAGYTEVTGGAWPSDATLGDHGEVLVRDGGGDAVFRLDDGSLVLACLHNGWLQLTIAAADRVGANATVQTFQGLYPALFLNRDDEGVVVPFTFWMLGQYGPERRLRRVDSADWTAVKGNYTGAVRAELDRLTSPDFEPGADGQLILWHGPPGTGKTWAIRALASAWAPWAEFNYITDPDAFFVQQASYMVDVLLHESYEVIDEPTGDLVTVAPAEKWRVLVLEDTGELLSADAKEKSGQGLSRLLNVVDGLIGQGLRVLVLVTTNDQIEELHPAVTRPGRCASTVLFGPLSAAEASEWAGEPVDQPMTLAELYARGDAAQDAFAEGEVASGVIRDSVLTPTLDYQVYDAALDPLAQAAALDPLTQAALDAAREPLPELATPAPRPDAAVLAVEVESTLLELLRADPLTQLIQSRNETLAAAERIASRRVDQQQAEKSDRLADRTLEVLARFADRPDAPAPIVNVTVPEQDITVHVDGAQFNPQIDVHVPEQAAPVVHLGDTTIHVPAAETVPMHVDIHVPEQPPAPAPVVTVVAAAAPPAPAGERRVRFVENELGEREAIIEALPPPADE